MLRKLVKYSENSALILDKALLETLGVQDNSLINIEVRGKSLIITASKNNASTSEDYIKDEVQDNIENELQADFAILNSKYSDAIEKINAVAQTEEFQKEVMLLADKYKDKTNSQEYFIAFTKLRYKYVPELKALDEERKKISLKNSFGSSI